MDCKEISVKIIREGDTRSLIKIRRKRQATLFGRVMRREKLEHLVTPGKIEGKHSSGKQRVKMLGGLKKKKKSG